MTRKYRNTPVWFNELENGQETQIKPINLNNWKRFDSKLELTVYKIIRRLFPAEWVHKEPKLVLKSKSHYSAAIAYRPDFLIASPDLPLPLTDSALNNCLPYRFIEAKGILTPASKLKLQIMELSHPVQYKSFWIVGERRERFFGVNYQSSFDLVDLEIGLEQFLKSVKIALEVKKNGKRK